MKKRMIVAMLAGVVSGASAHSDGCDFSIDYNIHINDQQISFDKKEANKIVFDGDRLFINGHSVTLTDKQLQASKSLQKQTLAIVPKIADIAVEGAELGVKAATIALTGLFGDSENVQKDLIEPIEAISAKIKANISDTSLNADDLHNSFNQGFEDELESLVETTISKYSAKMISQIISSIFSGDEEDVKDFEFRMENMEHDIESYVEKHAESLEKKADALCDDFESLLVFDQQLESIKGYPENGLFQQDSEHGFRVSGLSFNRD